MSPFPTGGHRPGAFACLTVLVASVMTAVASNAAAASHLGAGRLGDLRPSGAGRQGDVPGRWAALTGPGSFFQDGPKMAPSDESGASQFGYSVAISSDGTTALVGGPDDGGNPGPGAAWVFTRTSSGWAEQAKLIPDDELGAGHFGTSVALSADGNTALIGGPNDGANDGDGAAWIFTRSGSTWAQQGSKLTPDDVKSDNFQVFGASVALSADGDTALIGGPGPNDVNFSGYAWVFVATTPTTIAQGRTGAFVPIPTAPRPVVWEQQGGSVTCSPRCYTPTTFGGSVALSADGSTALIGETGGAGGFASFTRTGSTWSLQGWVYPPVDFDSQMGNFPATVALSPDGTSAFLGAPDDGSNTNATGPGAVWFYQFGPQGWQEIEKVTPSDDDVAAFGSSVAVSPDGSTLAVGGDTDSSGVGAAWLYSFTGGALRQEGTKLTATDETGAGMLGSGVAVTDGSGTTTLLVGGSADNSNDGAAWVFTDAPPVVSGVLPATGPANGGTAVTITGDYLQQVTGVDFGTVAATSVKVVSDNEVTALAPPGAVGNVDVTVTGPNGPSATSSADVFTYTAALTTTAASTTTTRPKPKAPPKPKPLALTGIHASVLRHGSARQLVVDFRASEKAHLQLELLAHKSTVFSESFSITKGANNLAARLPASVGKGTDVLELVVKDAFHRHKTYTASVNVPA